MHDFAHLLDGVELGTNVGLGVDGCLCYGEEIVERSAELVREGLEDLLEGGGEIGFFEVLVALFQIANVDFEFRLVIVDAHHVVLVVLVGDFEDEDVGVLLLSGDDVQKSTEVGERLRLDGQLVLGVRVNTKDVDPVEELLFGDVVVDEKVGHWIIDDEKLESSIEDDVAHAVLVAARGEELFGVVVVGRLHICQHWRRVSEFTEGPFTLVNLVSLDEERREEHEGADDASDDGN